MTGPIIPSTNASAPASPQSLAHDTGRPAHLRAAVAGDTPALLDLAVATALFAAGEVDPLRDVLEQHHTGETAHGLHVWSDMADGSPVGVVYFGPNHMTDGTWDLLWIAVAPERQGQGIGGELIRLAERQAQFRGGRLLVVDTSSLPKFDAAHAFYRSHGYGEVARIPDFYTDGESKVIFIKRLKPA